MAAPPWTPEPTAYPIPPQNGMVVSSFQRGSLDIRWDDPANLAINANFNVVGVNIYRSDASDRGPYYRINEMPVGGSFYRDRTDYVLIDREKVEWSAWNFLGNKPNSRQFSFRTQYRIIKKDIHAPYQTPVFGNAPVDATLYVNGEEVAVQGVFGRTGEVTLINQPTFNVGAEKIEEAPRPFSEDDLVEVSYWTCKNFLPSGLGTNLWYRLTTVVLDEEDPSGYSETPLNQSKPCSLMEIEALDYIWKEAVRRNNWILQQGGERVKLFVRKVNGVPCDCTRDQRTLEWGKQPENSCLRCYGTGFIGGYEGPYDTILAPDDGERRISQSAYGRRTEHSYEVWMGPSPVVTQRDFIVKQTNERYSIGPVRRPSNRGNVLQQHFNIAYFDEGDIRYRVPVDGTDSLPWPATRGAEVTMPRTPVTGGKTYDEEESWGGAPYPEGASPVVTPMATEKTSTPDALEPRGRTKVWQNQNS